MLTTSPSLLQRVRDPGNRQAWGRFVQLYTPLLHDWARRSGLQDQDAADLVQEVFVALLQKLPEFRYDRDGSFRGWLRTVLHNKWREIQRRRVPLPLDAQQGPLAELPAPPGDDPFGVGEYREYLVRRVLELVRGDFEPTTWQAWEAYAVGGRPAAEVARELGLSVHAVYLAKARVLRRLREEVEGLLDD